MLKNKELMQACRQPRRQTSFMIQVPTGLKLDKPESLTLAQRKARMLSRAQKPAADDTTCNDALNVDKGCAELEETKSQKSASGSLSTCTQESTPK